MYSLTEGALDQIMGGSEVDKPVLQILGHKKLASSSSGERYRLLVSDGLRINSFTMLATQLNSMITDNILTEFSICQINRYATSIVNHGGKEKRVMVILNIDVKVPGDKVGHKIGNPNNAEAEPDAKPAAAPPQQQKVPEKSVPKQSTNQSSSTNASNLSTTPICALSPYQNRWVIKARVVSKSPIRTWNNSRGEGKLFSIDLLDETGEIRCTAFRDQCDKFYDMIQIGNVYYISRCTLKTANKTFNNLNHDFEMSLTGDSEIIPCHEESDDIPTLQFDFVSINEVETKQQNDIMDILGVVKSCGDLQIITSRNTGRELKKRDVNLVDESNTMVCLTLWGTQAEEFNGDDNPVLAIKGARVGEFNGGKTLSTLNSTVLQVDPDIPAAHRLRGWFNSTGRNEESKSLSKAFGGSGGASGPWLTFAEAKEMELGKDGPEVYTVKATVNLIRVENALYKACPTDNCKKKLVDQSNEMYRCEKCDRQYPNFKYRLLASASLADWTENQWVTAFNEEAEKLLGVSAQELGELQQNDNDMFLAKFADATFQNLIFKIRVKKEVYSDENKLKATCLDVSPMDYKSYNNHMLTKIKDILGIKKE